MVGVRTFILFCVASIPTLSLAQCNPKQDTGNSTCAVRGDVLIPATNYQSGAPQIVNTRQDCLNLCTRRRNDNPGPNQYCRSHFLDPGETYDNSYGYYCPFCSGFLYSPKTGFCQLVGKDLDGSMFQPRKKADIEYTQIQCYDCEKTCISQDIGTQLLDNGDFSGQLLGPWNSVYNGMVLPRRQASSYFACNASQGTLLQSNDDGQHPERVCVLQQGFEFCNESLYSLQFDYKIPNSKQLGKKIFTGFSFREWDIDYANGALSYTRSFAKTTTQEWTTAQIFFRGSTYQTELAFAFYQLTNVTGNLVYGVTNVLVKRIPDSPTPKLGASPAPINGLKYNQTLATTPGNTYLLSLNFTISNRSYAPHIILSFLEGQIITRHAHRYNPKNPDDGNSSYSFSVPYRAETKSTKLVIIPDQGTLYFGDQKDIPVVLKNISFIELQDL